MALRSLPPSLRVFLESNAISETWYLKQIDALKDVPRHVRFCRFPAFLWTSEDHRVSVVKKQLTEETLSFFERNDGKRLDWACFKHCQGEDTGQGIVEGFREQIWCVPPWRTLSKLDLYRNGGLQGVDAASLYAVECLDVRPNQSVLDLCCAPGAKLISIADRMKRSGELVGVDVSKARLDVSSGLARQYYLAANLPEWISPSKNWNFSLVNADGTKFTGSDSDSIRWDNFLHDAYFGGNSSGKRRISSRSKARVKEARKCALPSSKSFDRVIVDVQCSHEGSVRHVVKHLDSESSSGPWSRDKIDSLFDAWNTGFSDLQYLQRCLIRRGFELLKPGGILVYSTCSFSRFQNEDIVQWLMSCFDDLAILLPHGKSIPCRESEILPNTVYFDPIVSKTSGLFVAKIQKKHLAA